MMKKKNIIWVLFILIAGLVTAFNVYRLWGIYNEPGHRHNENCGHEQEHDHRHDDMVIIHPEFSGIKTDRINTDIQSSTFAANNSNHYYTRNIICKEYENDNIYWYSAVDNAVYVSWGDSIEKLFEKQAAGLIHHNEKLYFLSYEDTNNPAAPFSAGPIWMYDLTAKELSIFSELMVLSFNIFNDNFYCLAVSDDRYQSYQILNDGTCQEIDYVYCGSYKDYYLVYDFKYSDGFPPLYLLHSETGETIQLLANNIFISEQSIYKDTLYYIYYSSIDSAEQNYGDICSLNLITGEKKVYGIEKLIGHTHDLSYNFANDKIYLVSDKKIAEIDMLTDKITKKNIRRSPSHLYSDGETLYLVKQNVEIDSQLALVNGFASLYKAVK